MDIVSMPCGLLASTVSEGWKLACDEGKMVEELCCGSISVLLLLSSTLVVGDTLVDVVLIALDLLPFVFLEGWRLVICEGKMAGELCSSAVVGDGELRGFTEVVLLGKTAT